MSLYQREGSPFWWYTFNVNGLRFRGSTGETEKRKARTVERDKQQEAEQRGKPKQHWTIKNVLAHYWSEVVKDTASADIVLAQFDKMEKIIGADTRLADLNADTLLAYRAKRRADKGRKGEQLAANTVNRDFAYLQAAIRHAAEVHRQPAPPIAWRKLKVKEPPHRTRFLSREEYDALCAAATQRLRKVIIFAVATGLRQGNIFDLDWSQVNMSAGLITVHLGKGNKRHTVRITPPLRAMLSTLGERKGKVFDTTNYRREWAKAVKDAGIADFTFHDLRHTNASWARTAGADIADICEALGHSSVNVTMRYAHLSPDHKITAFERVSEVLWSQSVSQSEEKAG